MAVCVDMNRFLRSCVLLGLCLIASTATAQTLVVHHNANLREKPTTQAATRNTMKVGIDRARRPKYLFSGLTQCASSARGVGTTTATYAVGPACALPEASALGCVGADVRDRLPDGDA